MESVPSPFSGPIIVNGSLRTTGEVQRCGRWRLLGKPGHLEELPGGGDTQLGVGR